MNTIVKECYESHKSWEKVPLGKQIFIQKLTLKDERIKVVKKAAEYFLKVFSLSYY